MIILFSNLFPRPMSIKLKLGLINATINVKEKINNNEAKRMNTFLRYR